ncbi:MAG: sulfite exporter TauE/SafE family protein [Hyphomonadaceae bacterium]|nr:sulfite exporter TauE/SafE family protein [Clostridia bacterium]
MSQTLARKTFHVQKMTCSGCELRIENGLKKLDGVNSVKASYVHATIHITFDADKMSAKKIVAKLNQLGYPLQARVVVAPKDEISEKSSSHQLIAFGLIIFALYFIIQNTVGFNFMPNISQNMSLGLLFIVGLLTSLHCIAMCGGINLSQSIASEKSTSTLAAITPSLMYNAGRVVSYTLIGGVVGALGAVISFTGWAQGIVAVLSGLFMIIMGLNMLNIFPALKNFIPTMPKIFSRKLNQENNHTPFYVGLINGLMPCGPLQAMQLYALGTGSFMAGASAMFFFSLGTVPLMFGFGAMSTFLSGKFTKNLLKASAILVMVLGILMVNRGLSLSGIATSYATQPTGAVAKIEGNVQVVTSKVTSGGYEPIVVQKGIPVQWTIHAEKSDLNGCNRAITIPKYGIKKNLVAGDTVVSFTPTEDGNIGFTCWMGMISSNIAVVSDVSSTATQTINESVPTGQNKGGCCGN